MGPPYRLGRTTELSRAIVWRLVCEARSKAQALAAAHVLPPGYDLDLFEMTRAGLETT